MNIVVVINCSESRCRFIRAARDWVMTHPVDTTLYIVRAGNRVRIGPYNINFVCGVADTRGLRAIDMLYYHNSPTSAMLDWEVGHRMAPDGKKFFLLSKFMEEVFHRVEQEAAIFKNIEFGHARKMLLNSVYGAKAVNYPEDYIAKMEEAQEKADNMPYGLIDFSFAKEIDHLNDEILRQYCIPVGKIIPNAIAYIKEEKTMNCDVRLNIKDVIFSDRVTVILWKDGTKTMVRAGKREHYDPEKGFAMAVCKKMFGNKGNYYEVFKKYVPVTDYIVDKKDAKKDIMITDQAVSDEVKNEIAGMINECQEKGKIWPGLTRKKWKELVNKVAKCVTDKRKREEAEADCKKKKEGIRSGKYPWGMYMGKYMTPPEDETNNSDGEE